MTKAQAGMNKIQSAWKYLIWFQDEVDDSIREIFLKSQRDISTEANWEGYDLEEAIEYASKWGEIWKIHSERLNSHKRSLRQSWRKERGSSCRML